MAGEYEPCGPWTPVRLEQRIGRVDRIGQRRTVHVFHLVARETNETRVLEQLRARIARAQQDIAADRVHARFEAHDRDVVSRVPAAHAVGLEYRLAVARLLAH